MALPCPSRAMQTIYWWNPCLDHFWLAPGQKNKLQQKSFKLSSFISGTESFHQKFSVSNSKYKNWQRLARVKIKNLNIRIFHKFLLKIKLMYICCYLHIEINTPHQNFTCSNDSVKILYVHTSIFLRQGRSGNWCFNYVILLSSVSQYFF